MTDFKIQGGVSWGNIISVVVTIVTVAVGYQALSGEVNNATTWIKDEGKPSIARLSTEASADRLSANTILTNVQADVRYMRERIDELRSNPPSN